MALEILPLGAGRAYREAQREAAHPIPWFDIPEGWQRNEPMCEDDRTELELRNDAYDEFIDIVSTDHLAEHEGPYYAELLEQVGPRDSFETRVRRRIVAIEPGAIQEAVDELAEEVLD